MNKVTRKAEGPGVKRQARPYRPSPSMLRALANLRAGRHAGDGIVGMSASGGFGGTLLALQRHGLADRQGPEGELRITETGRSALGEEP